MESIRRRAMELFPSTYMTMVSLIEAIALELLVGRLQSMPRADGFSSAVLIGWLQIAFMFEVVLGVWIAYAILSTAARWITTFRDSAVVFALGIWQFLAIGWIGEVPSHYWLGWGGVGCFIAIVIVRGAYVAARRIPGNEIFVRSFPVAFVIGLVSVVFLGMLSVVVLVQLKFAGEWLVAAYLMFVVAAYGGYIRAWTGWWQRAVAGPDVSPGNPR
jgi:hypothetical protein